MNPTIAVPNYGDAYNSLDSVYTPQVNQVQSEIDQLPGEQQAQQSSLDQAKVNAFQDITNSANSKGVLFSGFTPDQQAQYIGTKYLPAVANLNTTFQNNKNTLLDKINQINSTRSQQAQGIVSSAQTAADTQSYDNAKLAISASKAANATPKALTQTQVSAAIRQGLNGVKGKDGYVSPQDYAQAYSDWTQAGYSASTFDNYFGDLMNPKNGYYQYAESKV